MVELIPFRRPAPGSTLYLTGIPSALPPEEKWHRLHSCFSDFGLLDDIYLPGPQSDTCTAAPPSSSSNSAHSETEYGFVRFYSKRTAKRAQAAMNGKLFMSGKMVRVHFSTRKQSSPSPPLHISHCHRLASHYLGFNGWSVHIRSMKLRGPGEEGEEEEEGQRYLCEVGLTFRSCRGESIGEGEGLLQQEHAAISRVQAIGLAKKQAFCRACEAAFSNVVLAVLPSGKVSANLVCREEDEEQLVSDCPPVNVLPASAPVAHDSDDDTI